MLTFVRITEKSLAVFICRHLWRHNFVRRTSNDILRSPHYAIYEENTLVGWIGYRRVGKRRYEIKHLTVLPEARQHGIGRAAVTYVVKLLRERGADSCHAYIRPINIPSIRLFFGQGFRWTKGSRMRKYTLYLCLPAPSAAQSGGRRHSAASASFSFGKLGCTSSSSSIPPTTSA
ncbi:MAG: GNAT family N-acetyltransferase [Selenomonadales bacterium]|nr:GNAT family N-acetyltransferase [Selenomonadales bacterium]